jgi:putative oxidoreductase
VLVDIGLLVVRVVVGVVMIAHGLQKLGYLGGDGLAATAGMLARQGFAPGRLWATAVAAAEAGGGLLLLLGLLGPVGPALIVTDLLVAMWTVHWPRGFFITKGGIEFTLVLIGTSVGLALTGFGAWSLDAVVGLVAPDWLVIVVLALAVVAAAISLGVRRSPSSPPAG